MDEICPEMLKSLDIVGLSCLTCLFSVEWRSETVPLDQQTRVMVPLFKKGAWESVFQLSGYHTAQSTWESLYQGARKEASASC